MQMLEQVENSEYYCNQLLTLKETISEVYMEISEIMECYKHSDDFNDIIYNIVMENINKLKFPKKK